MKHLLKIFPGVLFLIFNLQVFAAVNIVECEDEKGDRSFHKTCPPGTTKVGSKRISTGAAGKVEDINTTIKATVYVIPECESCDEVREFLNNRNISFEEKNVSDDLELQKELTDVAGGLKVPTTVIGDEIITGYSRSRLLEALASAGFVKPAE